MKWYYIRRALDLEESDAIPENRMKELTVLELGWSKPYIYDLTGLEKANNLTELNITNAYSISDITPIGKLTKLQKNFVIHLQTSHACFR